MGIVGLVFGVVVLVLIGVGIAIGLVACGLLALLIAAGVVSSSFLVGLHSGRSSDGVRAFLLQCGIIAGVPAGALCALLGRSFLESYPGAGADVMVLVCGGLGGAVAGILVALAAHSVFQRLHTWALARLPAARE